MHTLKPDWMLTAEGLRADWCLTIQSGRIVGVGPNGRHSEIVEALPGMVLIPGFVNAHSHAFQRAFRGHVQWKKEGQNDFWTWRDTMYRVANQLSPEGVEAISRLAFLEMAEAGITQVGEFHYLHHQTDGTPYSDPNELAHRVISAAVDVGIRICLLRVAYGRAGFERGADPLQRRFIDTEPDAALDAVETLSSIKDERVTVGLAPHSIRAVSQDWLQAYSEYEGPVHMHVSEQPAENQAAQREYGCSPTTVIQQNGLLSDRFTAVHMTHPVEGDLEQFRSAGARICVCPTTELDLGDGFLPNPFRKALPMCVGSDSQAEIHMMAEVKALEMHGRALAVQRNVLAPVGQKHGLAQRLLDYATLEGKRALGASPVGLEVGAPADMVGVSLARPAAFGVPPLEATVFSSTPDWVSEVWVQGSRIVTQGRHPARQSILSSAKRWLL